MRGIIHSAVFWDTIALFVIVLFSYSRIWPPVVTKVDRIGDECATQSRHEIRSPQWIPHHTVIFIPQRDVTWSYLLVMDSHLRHTPDTLLAIFVPAPSEECQEAFTKNVATMTQYVAFFQAKGLKVHWREIRDIRQWLATTPLQNTDIQHKHVAEWCKLPSDYQQYYGAHVSDLLHALGSYHFGGLARDSNLGMLRSPDILWAGLGSNMLNLYFGEVFFPTPRVTVAWFSAEPRSTLPLSLLWAFAILTREIGADLLWPIREVHLDLGVNYDMTGEKLLSPILSKLIKHGYKTAAVRPEDVIIYNRRLAETLSYHEVSLPRSEKTIKLINSPDSADCNAISSETGDTLTVCGFSSGIVFRRPYAMIVLGVHYIQAINWDDKLSSMTVREGQQAVLDRLDGAICYHFYGEENNVTERLHDPDALPSQREMWRYLIDQMCLTLCDEKMMQLIAVKDFKSADALWKSSIHS